MTHATYDPVYDRVYVTGGPGFNLTARDPSDLTSVPSGWPEENAGVVAARSYDPNVPLDYSIALTTDSTGNIYISGHRAPGRSSRTLRENGCRIEKFAPDGTFLGGAAVGGEAYECTEVFTHEEGEIEYLYAMGFYVFDATICLAPSSWLSSTPVTGDQLSVT